MRSMILLHQFQNAAGGLFEASSVRARQRLHVGNNVLCSFFTGRPLRHQLPRMVNARSSLQAASPAFETSRLFSILGVGMDVLMGFAYVLILISALSIFIALYNSSKQRRYDLAIMRSMGASGLNFLLLSAGRRDLNVNRKLRWLVHGTCVQFMLSW